MTPRERWIATLSGKRPDRWPTDYWATDEVTTRLLKDLACSNQNELWRRLGVDKPLNLAPRYAGPDLGDRDVWGLRHVEQVYADGAGVYREVVEHPLAAAQTPADLDRYPWPKVDWYDFSVIPDRLREAGDWPVRAGTYEPFLLYCQMRGLEQAFVDLLDRPDFVDAAIERLFRFHYEFNERLFEAGRGRIDITYVAEDFGSQTSLLMSPKTIETIFLPRIRKMIRLAHDFGIKVLFHSDGAIRPIIGMLIDAGIDALNPVQWRCHGMDRAELAAAFGNRIAFHGAVDNQQTLAFGTPDDVRNEVRENIEIFGRTRGYVIAPCHNIQPITPTANIVALYEAAREYGTLG